MQIERNEKRKKSIISQDHKATTTATAVVMMMMMMIRYDPFGWNQRRSHWKYQKRKRRRDKGIVNVHPWEFMVHSIRAIIVTATIIRRTRICAVTCGWTKLSGTMYNLYTLCAVLMIWYTYREEDAVEGTDDWAGSILCTSGHLTRNLFSFIILCVCVVCAHHHHLFYSFFGWHSVTGRRLYTSITWIL